MVQPNFSKNVLAKQLKGKLFASSLSNLLKKTKNLLTLRLLPLEIANNDLGASIGLENDNDMYLWSIIFEGPSDTLYEVSRKTLIDVKN